jgi:hypothetical protein
MSLTRITTGVISANAVSAAKLANNTVTGRNIPDKTVELRHLADDANNTTTINTLQANLNTVTDNVNTVQANVNSQTTNVNIVSANVGNTVAFTANVEARRVANIAGAISTVLTSDLTVSRALVSDGSGKIAVSDVTSTELGHLDGVSSAIQTQIDDLESRRAANLVTATFSDDVIITGNLIVNGDTTTANSVNMIVQDRMLMLANSATGAPAADVGFLFNRGNQGNAAFFYDESAQTFKISDTQDPSSNTVLSPVSAGNLSVGILSATTIQDATSISSTEFTQNGATLNDLISSNVDGAISSVNDTNLTTSRALVSDGSGKIAVSDVTSTELSYLDGVSSAIQTQLNAKISTTDSASNDFVTFTRLNANINVVQDNVSALSGSLTVTPFVNVNSSVGTSNVFFVGKDTSEDSHILTVSLDGLIQSNNEFVYHHSNNTIQFKDSSIPSGIIVQILSATE